jgi:hypothetical protein
VLSRSTAGGAANGTALVGASCGGQLELPEHPVEGSESEARRR